MTREHEPSDTGEPNPSRELERIAINRARRFGRLYVVTGVIAVVVGVALVVTSPRGTLVLHWLQLIAWVAYLVIGIVRLAAAGSRCREFQERNGRDAGKR